MASLAENSFLRCGFRRVRTRKSPAKKMTVNQKTLARKHPWGSGKPLPKAHRSLQKQDQGKSRKVSVFLHVSCFLTPFTWQGGPRVEVEYEQEMESVPLTKSILANW